MEERKKQSYTYRQHSHQKKKTGWKREGNRAIHTDSTSSHQKKKMGWRREENRAIHTDSAHTKRRRWGEREKETEL